MTTREFVEKLFSDCREGAEPMTIEEAEADIRNFDAIFTARLVRDSKPVARYGESVEASD